MKCTIEILDVCYPDYFQGSRHPVTAVPLSNESTWGEVIDALGDDLELTEEESNAFDVEIKRCESIYDRNKKFLSEEVGEDTYAYFAVKFSK